MCNLQVLKMSSHAHIQSHTVYKIGVYGKLLIKIVTKYIAKLK